ncbi:O-antigen ligase family protein [Microbacterium sp. NPDC089180]|uniref:O-antigen ligase family protein n=1 Tax=unclassified Microbacterium TaxID=2609290 RepID=UPI00341D0394
MGTLSESRGYGRGAVKNIPDASAEVLVPAPPRTAGWQLRIAFYAVYVALLMMAPTIVSSPARYFGVSSDTALYWTWLAINGFAVLLVLAAARQRPAALLTVILFSGYILASSMWSVAPQTSLQYGSTLVGVLCVAYLMSVDMGMRGILVLLARVTVTLSVVGLLLYVMRADIAIYVDAANRANLLGTLPFKGLFPHKIVAGFYAATGIVAIMATSRPGAGKVLSVLCLLAVIVLSSSSTALVLLPFAIAIYLLTRRALERGMRARAWIASLIITAIVGGLLMAWTWSDVLGLLSRDTTLTGRTTLWDWGLRTWAERPIFGWGYGAYFETPEAAAVAYSIPEFRSWDVPHFHQTYIQTAVDFGVVGLVALVVVIFKVLLRSYKHGAALGSSVAAGTFAIALTAAAAGFVMYLVPSYAYTEVVPLFLFATLFSTGAIEKARRRASPAGARDQRRVR